LHAVGHPDDGFPRALDHSEDGRLFASHSTYPSPPCRAQAHFAGGGNGEALLIFVGMIYAIHRQAGTFKTARK